MNWSDLGSSIAKIGLPLLGAVLPIPGGAAIGTALASAIGSGSADPATILQTLTESADAQAKAKQFEETHQETMLKLQLDFEQQTYANEVADRGSARGMQISTRSVFVPALALAVTLGFFGILGFMLTHALPAGQKDVLNMMLGSLGSAWISVVSFYFGSSHSSQQKDILLANSTPIQASTTIS